MKPYPGYKKQFSLFILGVLLLIPLFSLRAQTAQDIQSQINQKNTDIQNLEKEIAAYQSQLDSLSQQKDSLSNAIKELDLTTKKLNADIAVTQNKIDKTNLTIETLGSDIKDKQASIGNSIDAIVLEIKTINNLEQNNMLENMLSQNDFTSVWNDMENMDTVRSSIETHISNLQNDKVALQTTQQSTIVAKNELVKLKSQLSDQKKIVVQNSNEKNKLLQQTKNSESNYQKLLQQRIAQRDAFEKELEDYEAQLKFVLNPSELPSGRVLSWPLDSIFVTQLFGKTVASKRLYASGTHNGVDFRASVGTPVMAMADGVVLGVGDTDLTCYGASYGKFVFIKYNDGLSSTFGHLSLVKVSEGEQVKRGEVVAYSGATGHVTGPHLHVSLYASQGAQMASKASTACDGRVYYLPVAPMNAYLNVLDYLPPYTINTTLLNSNSAQE